MRIGVAPASGNVRHPVKQTSRRVLLAVMNFLHLLLLVGVAVTVGLCLAILRKVSQLPTSDTDDIERRIEAVTARLTATSGKIATETATVAGIEPATPTEGT